MYKQLNEIGNDYKPKTFIKLPPEDVAYLFVPVFSSAENEIAAHTSMFNPKKTDHYYELGSDSISLISEMVARFQRKNAVPMILAREDVKKEQQQKQQQPINRTNYAFLSVLYARLYMYSISIKPVGTCVSSP